MIPKYITTLALAKHFGVSTATIAAMMKSGAIPTTSYIRLGRIFRFDLAKVEQALLTRTAGLSDDTHPSDPEPQQLSFDLRSYDEDEDEDEDSVDHDTENHNTGA